MRSAASPPLQTQTLWGQGAVDLTLWPPGECSLGLGNNLGFIQQEAQSQAALSLIMVRSSLFYPEREALTELTPSQSHNLYLQLKISVV